MRLSTQSGAGAEVFTDGATGATVCADGASVLGDTVMGADPRRE